MKRSDRLALGIAGIGLAAILLGAIASNVSPKLHDAVHHVGLACLLLAAGVFLVAKRLPAWAPGRPQIPGAGGLQSTAKNLVIAGAVFLAGAIGAGNVVRPYVTAEDWIYWIVLGCGALGAGAIAAGAASFAIAQLFGAAETTRERERRW